MGGCKYVYLFIICCASATGLATRQASAQCNSSFANAVNFGVGTGPRAVARADLNNDNHLDLVVANESTNNVSVLLGNGNGTFQSALSFAAGTGPRSV